MRIVQVETQSSGSFILVKKWVLLGLKFLGKQIKSWWKLKYEVFPEWPYKILQEISSVTIFFTGYMMFDASCFLWPKHPFSTWNALICYIYSHKIRSIDHLTQLHIITVYEDLLILTDSPDDLLATHAIYDFQSFGFTLCNRQFGFDP